MRSSWNFHSAGQLVFGRGAVRQLGLLVARRNFRRAFVVTDERLIAAGLADRIVESLQEAGVATDIFRGGEPEPAIETAVTAADAATKFKPDCIVGLGGGSNMDLAKFTAVL